MDYDEFRRYLDQHGAVTHEHLVRGNELVAEIKQIMNRRSDEIMAQNRAAMARSETQRVELRQSMAEHHQAMQDIRFELTQMSMRGERVAQGFVDAAQRHSDELQEHRGVLRDLVAENGAQRQALLAILDRMRGGGGPATAGA